MQQVLILRLRPKNSFTIFHRLNIMIVRMSIGQLLFQSNERCETQMPSNFVPNNCNCAEDLCRFIGQTITIFTKSGGATGCGFTGVLISADCNCIRMLTDFGLPPACPIGSACCGDNFGNGGWGFFNNNWNNSGNWGNPFGSLCVIPTDSVVCYTLPVI